MPDDKFHTIILTPEAYAKFIEICENPPPPTQALIDLFKKYGRFSKTAPDPSIDYRRVTRAKKKPVNKG